jgi:cobalt-precorrin 5A hydrolase
MTTVAAITLSREGAAIAQRLAQELPQTDLYLHENIEGDWVAQRFSGIIELTETIFSHYRGLVYIAPCGVVVRALSGCLKHKKQDPAVVAVDAGGRWAISLLSGHEGGANDLAVTVANILSAEPVISTTTEALKTVIVGVGCRRGTKSAQILTAISQALQEGGLEISQVRLISSADIKSREQGLLEAANELSVPLRFISSEEIRDSRRRFHHSDFVRQKVNLPAVAEPAALLAGRRTRLILRKRAYNGVTVALAQESCLW